MNADLTIELLGTSDVSILHGLRCQRRTDGCDVARRHIHNLRHIDDDGVDARTIKPFHSCQHECIHLLDDISADGSQHQETCILEHLAA